MNASEKKRYKEFQQRDRDRRALKSLRLIFVRLQEEVDEKVERMDRIKIMIEELEVE